VTFSYSSPTGMDQLSCNELSDLQSASIFYALHFFLHVIFCSKVQNQWCMLKYFFTYSHGCHTLQYVLRCH